MTTTATTKDNYNTIRQALNTLLTFVHTSKLKQKKTMKAFVVVVVFTVLYASVSVESTLAVQANKRNQRNTQAIESSANDISFVSFHYNYNILQISSYTHMYIVHYDRSKCELTCSSNTHSNACVLIVCLCVICECI